MVPLLSTQRSNLSPGDRIFPHAVLRMVDSDHRAENIIAVPQTCPISTAPRSLSSLSSHVRSALFVVWATAAAIRLGVARHRRRFSVTHKEKRG
jgi:hypothetical protein